MTITGDFNVDDEVNGVDIRVLNSTVMKIDEEQTIASILTFIQGTCNL